MSESTEENVTQKPTFKELLERHRISFEQFYLQAVGIPTYEIEALYTLNIGILQSIQSIIAVLNEMTGEMYTVTDISTRHIYGLPLDPLPEERIQS